MEDKQFVTGLKNIHNSLILLIVVLKESYNVSDKIKNYFDVKVETICLLITNRMAAKSKQSETGLVYQQL